MGRAQPVEWSYNGRYVDMPPWAEVPDWYRRNRSMQFLIQGVIDQIPKRRWQGHRKRFTFTGKLARPVHEIFVAVPRDSEVLWAVHRDYWHHPVVLAPFVEVDLDELPSTNRFTVAMDGTPDNPRILRAYPGQEIPPLPGQMYTTRQSVPWWSVNAFAYREGLEDATYDWDFAPSWHPHYDVAAETD